MFSISIVPFPKPIWSEKPHIQSSSRTTEASNLQIKHFWAPEGLDLKSWQGGGSQPNSKGEEGMEASSINQGMSVTGASAAFSSPQR